MKRSLIKFGLIGVFALALSTAAAPAQPGNFGSSEQRQLGTAGSLLVQVRGGRGGGHFRGGHGFRGGYFRGNTRFHGRGFHPRQPGFP